MKKHLRAIITAIFAAITALITKSVSAVLSRIWQLLIGQTITTCTIKKSDGFYYDALIYFATLPVCGRINRFAAGHGIWQAGMPERTARAIYADAGSESDESDEECGAGAPEPYRLFGSASSSPAYTAGSIGSIGQGMNAATPISRRDGLHEWGVIQAFGKGKDIHLKPSVSDLTLDYKGKKIFVRLTSRPGLEKDQFNELMEITVVGRRRDLLDQLLADIAAFTDARRETFAPIFVSQDGDWVQLTERKMRAPESVLLDSDGVSISDLIADAKAFFAEREWYESLGIPYRRGYLLYGPPGGGKSSTIEAIAGALNLSLHVLRLAEDGMTDTRMERLIQNVGTHAVLVIEDVDAAMPAKKRQTAKDLEESPDDWKRQMLEEKRGKNASRITLSALLNALDGPTAPTDRLLFLTTNIKKNIEDFLDPALIRSGRADRHVYIGYASRRQIKGMYERFFPLESEDAAIAFADACQGADLAMSSIQEFLLQRRDDPKRALAEAAGWAAAMPKDEDEETEKQ